MARVTTPRAFPLISSVDTSMVIDACIVENAAKPRPMTTRVGRESEYHVDTENTRRATNEKPDPIR